MHDFKEKIYIIAYVDFLGTKNAMSLIIRKRY